MDFISLPPEVTSALIHSGPGAESLIEAANAWENLGTGLEDSAPLYTSVVSTLSQAWQGPSATAMSDAVAPFLTWLRNTAAQCQQVASSAQTAAAAFTSTQAAVVTPAQVAANRTRLMQLIATDRLGSNLAAIAETETQYQNMWANNSAALSRYEAAVTQALDLPQFTSPPTIASPAAAATQSTAVAAAAAPAASTPIGDFLESIVGTPFGFDPNVGWFGLANTYANQFVSSGFPINLLSLVAQTQSAQALSSVGGEVGQGLSEGESALGGVASDLSGAVRALPSAAPTGAMAVGVSMGKLTAPPAVVGLLPASQTPVQLASAATPLDAGDAGFGGMLPPLMPPPISAGSGWRKRKQPKYEDLQIGKELKGSVMPRSPSAG